MARLSLDPLRWVPGPFRGYFFLSSFKLPATCNTLFNFRGAVKDKLHLTLHVASWRLLVAKH